MSDVKERAGKGGVNEDVSAMLYSLGKYEQNVTQNKFKANAYRKAAKSVAEYDQRIQSIAEAKKLAGVGEKIAVKIMDFLKNGSNDQLERAIHSDKNSSISQLMRVSGIGPKVAAKLYSDGIETVEQLTTVTTLTDHQKIGLKYLHEFEQKIARKEIENIEKILLNQMNELNKNLLLTICGSYRREARECGDIDVLVSHQKITSEQMSSQTNDYLKRFVKSLENCGLITDRLTSLGDTKFMGVCRIAAGLPHRRIDIRFLPVDQYFCGILYFTGNDSFNRLMRKHANQMDFTLNEYSLRRLGSTGVPGEPIPISSEKEIFEYIDFPYKEPKDRNF